MCCRQEIRLGYRGYCNCRQERACAITALGRGLYEVVAGMLVSSR